MVGDAEEVGDEVGDKMGCPLTAIFAINLGTQAFPLTCMYYMSNLFFNFFDSDVDLVM